MNPAAPPPAPSAAEVEELRLRLAEANETLEAIRAGAIDALVINGPAGEAVFTLRGADEPYRVLIEQMNEGAASLSADGVILYANRRMAEILRAASAHVMGERFTRFLPPGEHSEFHRLLRGGCRGRSVGRLTVESPGLGSEFLRVAFRRLPPNAVGAVCLVATDITEMQKKEKALLAALRDLVESQKALDAINADLQRRIDEVRRNEETLRASAQRLALATEAAEMGVWEWEVATGAAVWDERMYRIFGVPEGESINYARWAGSVLPDDLPAAERILRECLSQRVTRQFDFRIHRASDGEVRHIQAAASPVLDATGEVARVVGINFDVSERRRGEEALRRSAEQFRLFIANAPVAVAMFDREMRYLAVSERWVSDFELGGRSLIGRCHYDVFPNVPDHWRASHRRCLAGATEVAETERFERPDGRIEWLRREIRPWRDLKNEIGGLIVYNELVTERKLAQEKIRALNAELAQRVEERTAQLEAANRELESFSYSVSHDLRAPLRSIDGFSRILLEDYGDKLDAEGRDSLVRVRAATQRMAQLIDDMLTLSRFSRNPLRRVPVDITLLVESVAAELRRAEPGRNVELRVAPGLTAEADPDLLRVTFENLLGNAWKFTSERPVAHVEVGSESVAGETVFHVRDDGAGFDMTYVDKLFTPFQRLHDEREFPGTGIGLATVQRIIRRHGGRVWAEGTVGGGATFRFTLAPPPANESPLP